jgi:hypothetical protein
VTSIGNLLAVLPDPLAEIELRRQLAREAYDRGRTDGWHEGHEAAEREMAERWDRIARTRISLTAHWRCGGGDRAAAGTPAIAALATGRLPR